MNPSFNVLVPDGRYFERQVLCREACPVRTDAGAYVQAIAEGRYEDAYVIARTPNPFASICGRVCAAPCEAACRRGDLDAPVAIRSLKRFVCERYGVESRAFDLERLHPGWNRAPMHESGQGRKVAVVGAGPAGLSCAHDLALMGFAPTVFEAQAMPGGMLVLGVPEYRLPREIIQAEIRAIELLGVEIICDRRLGRDFTIGDLKQRGFEAIFLGMGAHKSRELAIEGVELDGVLRAIDYLLNVNLGYNVRFGQKVVVIGGGSVAFDVARSLIRQAEGAPSSGTPEPPAAEEDIRLALDVARTALREGVPNVHLYCLESLDEIPADREEIEVAQEEGIQVHTRWGPRRLVGREGKVSAVDMVRCERAFDEAGRFAPTFVEGSDERIDCDTVVLAIGQQADLSWVRPEDGLDVTRQGTVKTDRVTLATSRPDVFAGGDLAFGARIIIDAVAEGKRAACSIAKYLAVPLPEPRRTIRTHILRSHGMATHYEKIAREKPPLLPIDRRVGVAEVENVFPNLDAVRQAERCLACHVSPVFDGDACILCGGCADVCPESCLRLVDVAQLSGDDALPAILHQRYGEIPVAGQQAAIIKDETRCIRCGLCEERCPTHAITMEKVSTIPA